MADAPRRWRVCSGWIAAPQVAVESLGFRREEGYVAEDLILGRVGCGERVRAVFFLPRGPQGKLSATLIADANWGDEPGVLAQGLLQAGGAVLIVAPFLTDGTEREGHDEMDPLYHTYNQATLACRVQDILTGLAYLDQHLRVGQAPPRRSGRGWHLVFVCAGAG